MTTRQKATYAAHTHVAVEKSQIDIQALLKKYDADQIYVGLDNAFIVIAFRIHTSVIRLSMSLPSPTDLVFRLTPTGQERSSAKSIQAAYDQEVRSRWRSLLAIIHAKLEFIRLGLSSLEKEFLADMVLPDGRTVWAWIEPQLQELDLRKEMPHVLPGLERAPAGQLEAPRSSLR